MRYLALIIFAVMTIAPVSAQYAALRPRGAVPLLDGCDGMSGYPDCHPGKIYPNITYQGRSVSATVRPGMQSATSLYPPGTQFYPTHRR
jgi:hypothetical protein